MTRRVVVLEGICASGKSTLLKNLKRTMTLSAAPNCDELGVAILPPPSCPEEAERNDLFYMGLDVRRSEIISQMQANAEGLIIVDRDATGTLSISYGYHPLYRSFPVCAKCYIGNARNRKFSTPAAYLWLQASVESVRDRLARKGARTIQTGPGWTTPEALTRQRAFLEGYFHHLRGVSVYPIDANGDPDRVLQQALPILDSIRRQGTITAPGLHWESSAAYVEHVLRTEFDVNLAVGD
jgi:hypothetical protein